MVERVLINLIGNPLNYPGRRVCHVKFTELSDRIQGQVSDTGSGSLGVHVAGF